MGNGVFSLQNEHTLIDDTETSSSSKTKRKRKNVDKAHGGSLSQRIRKKIGEEKMNILLKDSKTISKNEI